MANEILQWLLRATLLATAAVVLVLAVRPLLWRLCGVQTAYLAWGAVPTALLAGLLPIAPAAKPVMHAMVPVQQQLASYSEPLRHTASHWPALAAAIWLAGCAALLLRMWQEHARYRQSLGALQHMDGLLYAEHAGSPAVVGLWRPVIIVPRDFAQRYTASERRLVLAHENVHLHRRDPLVNFLCALVQCALWFHPLVHLAARRFRLDQELACDAAVMRQHPGQRRSYAEAMLKTQLSSQSILIHCHWQSIHPLQERIMKLQQIPPRLLRQSAGRLFIAAMLAVCGAGAMAAQTGAAPAAVVTATKYKIDMELRTPGETSRPLLHVIEGEPFAIATNGKGGTWEGEFVLKKGTGEKLKLTSVVKHDGRVLGSPALLVNPGQPATIGINDDKAAELFEVVLTVTAL